MGRKDNKSRSLRPWLLSADEITAAQKSTFFFFSHLRKITSEAIITIKKKPKNFSFSPLDYSCSAHKDFSNCTLEIKSHQHSLCVITQSACVGRGGFKITLLLYKTLKGSWFRLSVIACLTPFPCGCRTQPLSYLRRKSSFKILISFIHLLPCSQVTGGREQTISQQEGAWLQPGDVPALSHSLMLLILFGQILHICSSCLNILPAQDLIQIQNLQNICSVL